MKRYAYEKGKPHTIGNAMEVLRESEHDVEVAPQGGGFVRWVRRTALELCDEEPVVEYTRARFAIDGDDSDDDMFAVHGWSSGKRWNGWATPLAEAGDLHELASRSRALGDDGGLSFVWDGKRLLVGRSRDGDPDQPLQWSEIEPKKITTPDGERSVYDVSEGLRWDVVEAKPKRMRYTTVVLGEITVSAEIVIDDADSPLEARERALSLAMNDDGTIEWTTEGGVRVQGPEEIELEHVTIESSEELP